MTDQTPLPIHRGLRRYRNPVEGRYFLYERPAEISAACRRCGSQFLFRTDQVPSKVYDEASGGYAWQRGEVCGNVAGCGACAKCGLITRSLNWPEAAYFQVRVSEGIVWAWNEKYLPALQARVGGDKVALRHMVKQDWNLARFISRLPRYAVLTKNRARILSGLNEFTAGVGRGL